MIPAAGHGDAAGMASGAVTEARLTDPAGRELHRVDLTDALLHLTADPDPFWRDLRARAPVAWQQLPDGRGFWAVTRHRDCGDVLADHEKYTSRTGTMLSMLGTPDPAGGRQMLVTDPPRHAALREPLQQALSPVALRRLTPKIQALAQDLIRTGVDTPCWDLAATMSTLPMSVAALLMGLPPEQDWDQLARWSTMAIAPDDPEYRCGGDPAATLRAAHRGLFEFFVGEADRRRRRGPLPAGPPDLVDRLLDIRVDGHELAVGDLIANCYSLLLGANVTTGHAVTGTVAGLLDDPAAYRHWATTPARLHSGVEEAIRWSSPVLHAMRHARRDTTLAGVPIRAGDPVVAWLISANRDEAAFPEPSRLNLARQPNRHLAFGAGVHYCVGAVTARVTLRVVFEEIFRQVERFEPAGPVVRLRSTFINGIKHLPVHTVGRQTSTRRASSEPAR
jgi:cytochrome P450